MYLQLVTGGHKIAMVHGTPSPVKPCAAVAGASRRRSGTMELLRNQPLWMPGAALALLAMLMVSCSDRSSREVLVDVQGNASLRNGSPLAGMSVFFHTPMPAGQSP